MPAPSSADQPRRGRIGDEQARIGIDARQALRAVRVDRIVAAGIEDDDVEIAAAGGHGINHRERRHRAALDVLQAAKLGADRQEVILAVDLRAVAGEIEQADAAPLLQLGAEGADGLHHLGLVGVGLLDHLEACALKRRGHGVCVVDRVLERREGIVGIADDQRGARLRRLGPGKEGDAEQNDDAKQDFERTHHWLPECHRKHLAVTGACCSSAVAKDRERGASDPRWRP